MAKNKPAPRPSPGKPAAGKFISIRGAREHNLKTVDLDLPRDGLIASADLSGASRDIAK